MGGGDQLTLITFNSYLKPIELMRMSDYLAAAIRQCGLSGLASIDYRYGLIPWIIYWGITVHLSKNVHAINLSPFWDWRDSCVMKNGIGIMKLTMLLQNGKRMREKMRKPTPSDCSSTWIQFRRERCWKRRNCACSGPPKRKNVKVRKKTGALPVAAAVGSSGGSSKCWCTT